MWYLRLALDKIQAISFKVVKACYPFTIKGWLFSLLCCQPEAVPVYLKALTPLITLRCQYLPLIWNGQAKAQPPNRFILSLTNTVIHKTRRSYREQALPGHTNSSTQQTLLFCKWGEVWFLFMGHIFYHYFLIFSLFSILLYHFSHVFYFI